MQQIAMFLNGERGLGVTRAVLDAGHSICCAIVPNILENRNFIAKNLSKFDIRVDYVENVNEQNFLSALRERQPMLNIIAGFPTIFRRPLIEIPALGTINLHAGRLPGYRGGSPLNWQMINGELAAGISVIRIDEGIDTGPVLAETEIAIDLDDDIADLHRKANSQFPKLVVQV